MIMRATESQLAVARAKRAYDAAVKACKAKNEWPSESGEIRDGNGRIIVDVREYVSIDYAGAARDAGHLTPMQFCKASGITPARSTSLRVSWK
jgi:hypothetical protein